MPKTRRRRLAKHRRTIRDLFAQLKAAVEQGRPFAERNVIVAKLKDVHENLNVPFLAPTWY